MSLKEQLVKWASAVDVFESGDYKLALKQFQQFADMSKLHFNVGMIAMRINSNQEAIIAFNRAIACDKYFALAYFQRGVVYYYDNNVELALENFQESYQYLRGNTHIDYTQLGLSYVLYEACIIFNVALCYLILGDVQRGLKYISQSEKSLGDLPSKAGQPDTRPISDAKSQGVRAAENVPLYELPPDIIFRPPEESIKNAQQIQHLGKSIVVASQSADDNFNGFSGRKLKEQTLGRNYRKKTPTQERSPPPSFAAPKRQPPRNRSPTTAAPVPRSNPASRNPPTARIQTSNRLPPPKRTPGAAGSPSPTISRRTSSKYRGGNAISVLSAYDDDSNEVFRPAYSVLEPESKATANYDEYPVKNNGYEEGDQSSSVPSNSSQSDLIKIKAHFLDSRMIKVDYNIEFEDLLVKLRKKFNEPDLEIKFKDDDGSKIVMRDDDDLTYALESVLDSNTLEVFCFVPE